MAALTSAVAMVDRGRISPRATLQSPHKIACDDGNLYVVKPTGTDRQFANELLGFAFASLLGVPVFDAAIVTISPAFIAVSPSLPVAYSPGLHFGCEVPTRECFDGYNASPSLVLNQVANAAAFYRLAMFDEMIHNGDRGGNPGNVVFVRAAASPQEFEFRAIDHGYAFTGPAWTVAQLVAHIPNPIVPVLTLARDLITSRAELSKNAAAVVALTGQYSDTIEQAQSSLTDEERAAVLELVQRRSAELAGWVAGPEYAAQLPSLA